VALTRSGPATVHALCLTGTAFLLHFLWESVQCPLFFVHRAGDATWFSMVRATLGDVLMTWIAQVVVAVVSKQWLWSLRRWGRRQWAALLLVALAMSVAVELYAVEAGRWSYTSIHPLLPGTPVGLLPVAQLLILFPLTFVAARRMMQVSRPARGSS
jgi:hypothetical protein